MPDPRENERVAALRYAVDLHAPGISHLIDRVGDHHKAALAVADTATVLYGWLRGPYTLIVTISVYDRETGQLISEGDTNMAQITTIQRAHIKARVIDKGGFGIPDRPGDPTDDIEYAIEGDAGVVTLTVSDDTREAWGDPAGLGSTVIRVTFPTAEGPKTATGAIDVINSEADRLELTIEAVERPAPEG
jgi:hypothetical protein